MARMCPHTATLQRLDATSRRTGASPPCGPHSQTPAGSSARYVGAWESPMIGGRAFGRVGHDAHGVPGLDEGGVSRPHVAPGGGRSNFRFGPGAEIQAETLPALDIA